MTSFSCTEQRKQVRCRANNHLHVLTPGSFPSQNWQRHVASGSGQTLPVILASFLSHLLSNTLANPVSCTFKIYPGHDHWPSPLVSWMTAASFLVGLLAQAMQSAQLSSWRGPCTRSSQMTSLKIKSKLLLLTYQTSCYFSGHFIPCHSISSCSFYSSHCGHLTVPQTHGTHFYLRAFAHSICSLWNDFYPKT